MTYIILSLKQLAKGQPKPCDYAGLKERTAAAWAALAPEIEKLGARLPGIAVERKRPLGVLLSMPGEKEKEAVTKIVRQQRVWRAKEAIRCDQEFVVRTGRRRRCREVNALRREMSMLDVTIYLKELDKALQVSGENDARERSVRRVEKKAGRMMPGLRSAIEAWAAARSDVCIRGETANGLHLSMHCDRSYAELEPALPRGWKSIVTRDSRKKKELWQAMDQMRP